MEIDDRTKHSGRIVKQWSIIGTTNKMKLRFSSDYIGIKKGFIAVWSPTDKPPSYPLTNTESCEHCVFPFVHEGKTFTTCTSYKDTKPWCQRKLPVDEGIHILPSPRIYCEESDTSCVL